MSNKIVPQVYRQVIDDVMANIKIDFDEYGMEDDVLINLQAKWEAKLLETRVADFARAPGATESPEGDDQPNSSPNPASPSGGPSTVNSQSQYGYYAPPPNGLALPGQGLALPGGQYDSPGPSGSGSGMVNGNGGAEGLKVKAEPDDVMRPRGGSAKDEPDLQVGESAKPEPNAAGLLPGDDIIDSDLDDSDDELKDVDDDGEEDADVDIVFCVYDKVQRVKNKWKTTFKDGMIHINGRDYLFGKCTGEFEW